MRGQMKDAAIDLKVDEALRRAPHVRVPAHFANRLIAALPASRIERPERNWMVPALSLAGASVLASLGWATVALGWAPWFGETRVLWTVLGTESAASLMWAWRMYRSAR